MKSTPNSMSTQKHESKRTIKIAAAASLLSVAALSGCVSSAENTGACEAFTQNGESIIPDSYPKGEIKVLYKPSIFMGPYQQATTGIIVENEGHYTLNVKDVPLDLTRDGTVFRRTNGAIAIKSHKTGVVAFSKDCMSEGTDEYGLPTTLVTLPSK